MPIARLLLGDAVACRKPIPVPKSPVHQLRVRLPGLPLSISLSEDGQTAYLGIQDRDKIVVVFVP
jgi:hypothetical protein